MFNFVICKNYTLFAQKIRTFVKYCNFLPNYSIVTSLTLSKISCALDK